MNSDGLIKASVLREFGNVLSEYRISTSDISSYNPQWDAQIEDDAALISLARYMEALEQAARITGDPLFPMKLGLRTRAETFGRLISIVVNQPTFGAALRILIKYLATYQQGAQAGIERLDSGLVRFSYLVGARAGAAMEADIDFTIGVYLTALRQIVGTHWSPREVHVVYPPVEHRAAMERLLGAPVWFARPASGLVFEADLLGLPMPDANIQIARALEDYLIRIEKNSILRSDLLSRLQLFLVSQLANGDISVAAAARACAISQRTMQRRLAELGLSYAALVANTRRDVAERLLRATSLPVTEIASYCGYSDPTNFHRAFLRWTGQTPTHFRRANPV